MRKKKNNFEFSIKQILSYKKKIRIKMKVVILAGGLGTRLSEYTKSIPKPMVK